jgi:predicted nuclease of restriction endonuclease-like (RecB) superfamily
MKQLSLRVQKLAPRQLASLLRQVRGLVHTARRAAAASVDTLQLRTNFEIGRLIVEHEQKGKSRAEYGKQLIIALSERLTAEFGRGFSRSNLQNMRNFFLTYGPRGGAICQKPSGELVAPGDDVLQNQCLMLSWSHYVLLLAISDAPERDFYEVEAYQGRWSFPELKRQVASGLYQRLALSRDKQRVRNLASEGQVITRPEDMLKSPYVLEFLGLDERPAYSESDLEAAIIGKLQHFLLELGKGFLFEARQKRFTIEEDHFYVDLVFYNRLLRCYVLIDLKIEKLTHQDLGQMQMYVNYFDRFVKREDEHPTVGIVLCKRKRDALVEITLPKDANIFASEYRTYLPSKEELQERLQGWAGS